MYATRPRTLQDLQRRITNVSLRMLQHGQREVQPAVQMSIVADEETFESGKNMFSIITSSFFFFLTSFRYVLV